MGCCCISGIDILKFTDAPVHSQDGSITFEKLNESNNEAVYKNVKVDWDNSTFSLVDQEKIPGGY